MKQKIFLLRHAKKESGSGDIGLSWEGKLQAKGLARLLSNELRGMNTIIWTSSSKRAIETATIIKDEIQNDVLVTEFLIEEKLWSDKDHRYDFMWLKERILGFNGENLIIISHLEYVQDFPKILGFCENNANYAQGVLIEDGKCIDFY